jgi:aquaporin Z
MPGTHEAPVEEPPLARRLAAEAFGTAALVFVAVCADGAAASTGEVGPAARAVAPALVVAALIYAIGDASGAHFNPAVTAAFVLKRLFPIRLVPAYWGAQLIGAVAASLAVRVLLGSAADAGVSTPHISAFSALGIEVALTILLVTVILGTADRHRIVGADAALAVGATIALCGLIALPLEGASMNPARSLAPALVSGRLGDAWIYIAGPFVGAALAVAIVRALHGPTQRDPEARRAAQGQAGAGRPSSATLRAG